MTLKKSEVETFKSRLEQLRRSLTTSLRSASEQAKRRSDETSYSQHQADQGTDDFDRTVSLELTSKEVDILKQIDRALEKIAEDTYGICDVTKKPIPKPRLEAIPYATMTVEAQEMLEKGLL